MDTKKLRQKILDLAIRGKLVSQDPNDEPASVLLERIRAEKERLINEGKIKRSKKTATDDEIEAPFEIPESWEWVRLADIASFGGGKTPSMDEKKYWQEGKHLWVTSKDMKCDHIKDSLMKISDEALSIMTQYNPGTLLMVTRSGILKHTLPIAILDKKATVNQDIKTISFYLRVVAEFIFYAIKANETFILKEYHKDGTTVDSINFEKFVNLLLPLPSIEEQKRIVTEVERCFAVIDELESNEGDLLKAIDQAKSKILDFAIHGKLVPQDPNDEPAIELLKRINPKFEPCDNTQYENIPFEVPNSWKWTIIGDLLINRDSERIPLSSAIRKKQVNKIYDYYGAAGVIDKVEGYLFSEKLLLIGEDGANLLSRSKDNAFFAEGNYWVNNHAHVLDCREKQVLNYVALVINSMSLENYITGSAQPKLTQENLNRIPIPIPPYQEQLRIVAKIEELFAVLDSIKESLEA